MRSCMDCVSYSLAACPFLSLHRYFGKAMYVQDAISADVSNVYFSLQLSNSSVEILKKSAIATTS